MSKKYTVGRESRTGRFITMRAKGSATTSSASTVTVSFSDGGRYKYKVSKDANEKIESAIYSYLQAVRSLGKEKVSLTDIAEALALPRNVVSHAMSKLKDKGVRAL